MTNRNRLLLAAWTALVFFVAFGLGVAYGHSVVTAGPTSSQH